MRREDFKKHLSEVRYGQTVQKETIKGSYLGEYIDSVRLNLEDDTEKIEFLIALTEEVAEFGYTDSKFNLDQRSRFVRWLQTVDSPYVFIFLYVFYDKEKRLESAIASEAECCAQLNTLVENLKAFESFDLILFAVTNAPDLFSVYEAVICEHLKQMDPYKMSQDIITLARAAKRCSGRLTIKLSRAIRLLLDTNITPAQTAYAVLCAVFGERGVTYLNTLSLSKTLRRKSDNVFLKFVIGLLEGDIRDEEKELLQSRYTEMFCQKINGYDSVSYYLGGIIDFPKELSYKDWLIFYKAESQYLEGKVNICQPYLRFSPMLDTDKWQTLTDWEKQELLNYILRTGLHDGSIGAKEIKKFEEFCLENEKLSLKEILTAGYRPGSNVIALLVEAGIWAMPDLEEEHRYHDDAQRWLQHYTRNPESSKSGSWVLNYYEKYGHCPSWFLHSNLEVIKQPWLQVENLAFRERYFFMFLNCLLLDEPAEFKSKLEQLCFGNWREEELNLRLFLEEVSLKKFVTFLLKEAGVEDRRDTLLRYLMNEEDYKRFNSMKEEMNHLKEMQEQITGNLNAWLENGLLINLRFSSINEFEMLQQEILVKVVIPSFKEQLINNQRLGDFACKMTELAENLPAGMQGRVLLELAKEIERVEGEKEW